MNFLRNKMRNYFTINISQLNLFVFEIKKIYYRFNIFKLEKIIIIIIYLRNSIKYRKTFLKIILNNFGIFMSTNIK